MNTSRSRSILYVIRSLHTGGAERQLVTQAIALHKRGYRVAVSTLYSGGSMEDELRAAGVSVLSLEKQGRGNLFKPIQRLVAQIDQVQPDVVYSFMDPANVLAAIAKLFRGKVRLAWGLRTADIRFDAYGHALELLFRLTVILSRRADVLIANSTAGATQHISLGYPSTSMRIVVNGIDTDRFAPDKAGAFVLRQEWGIRESEVVIGRVARIDPLKDYPTFLRALVRLRARGLEFRAVCAGSGSSAHAAGIRELAASLGVADRVLWVDSAASMPALYTAFDVLCATSISEGFPNVLGEAMACGTPCVTTDAGDSANVVGECGVVVPKGDDAAVAQALLDVLATSNQHRALECRLRVVSHFGLGVSLDRTTAALWPSG